MDGHVHADSDGVANEHTDEYTNRNANRNARCSDSHSRVQH